jgi:L-ascorbate metabolism protein UlaG (beta-lactamase superfamily)
MDHGLRQDPAAAGAAGYVTWFGHSTVRVDLDGVSVLTDPVLGRWVGPLRRTGPMPGPSAVTGVDVAVISHAHHDHLDLPSLRRLEPTTTVVVPLGAGAIARRAATGPVIELALGQSTTIRTITVTAVRAHHDGRRFGHNGAGLAVGYLLQGRHSVWFAGDTGAHPDLADLRDHVDLALIPIGGWGLTLGEHHLDALQAADVCALVHPASALPVHWGTLAVPGTRRLFGPLWARQDGARFVRALAAVAPDTRGLTPAMGERIAWSAPAAVAPLETVSPPETVAPDAAEA